MTSTIVLVPPPSDEILPDIFGRTPGHARYIPQEIEEVSQLASQHHHSEYSCSKFGPHGSPFRYVPLSLYAPEVFRELQHRQVQSANIRSWWNHGLPEPVPSSPVLLGPSGTVQSSETDSDELSRELVEAMDEEFTAPPPPLLLPPRHAIKTSSSHPIKVSYIIPRELLALVSSHLLLTSANIQQPTIFELPSAFTLDRLTTVPHHAIRSEPPLHLPSPISPPPAYSETTFACHLQTRSHVSEALQAAINSDFQNDLLAAPLPASKHFDAIPSYDNCTVKTFNTTTTSVSLSVAKFEEPIVPFQETVFDLALPPPESRLYAPPTPFVNTSFGFLDEIEDLPLTPQSTGSPPSPTLGNLLLSSCPGKKVRLDGPVRGRSAVCRDLESDLRRMKDMGIGCVVCCLDDAELEFLGAPWPEYERITKMIGMDVLRLPTPEGLPPSLSPVSLDNHITTLIQRYTLQGTHVLVHCRGGVGRAGVVACCWTLKLGLCGWLDEVGDDDLRRPTSNSADSVRLVEKVISVIRRRRGAKAVETYEQAKFLFDYVEYLKAQRWLLANA